MSWDRAREPTVIGVASFHGTSDAMEHNVIAFFLCGDVMTGRGIDQALPYPGSPALFETCSSDARDYLQLAEKANGTFQRPVAFKYVWGDVLTELSEAGTDVRNLISEPRSVCPFGWYQCKCAGSGCNALPLRTLNGFAPY